MILRKLLYLPQLFSKRTPGRHDRVNAAVHLLHFKSERESQKLVLSVKPLHGWTVSGSPAETSRCPKGPMYSYSRLALKYSLFVGTLGPKYILFGYLGPSNPIPLLMVPLKESLNEPIWVHGPVGLGTTA